VEEGGREGRRDGAAGARVRRGEVSLSVSAAPLARHRGRGPLQERSLPLRAGPLLGVMEEEKGRERVSLLLSSSE